MKLLIALLAASAAHAQIRLIPQPSKSPLVTFRVVFSAGSAADPPAKAGLASLTASMLADGGTKTLTYQEITDTLFPMAASFSAQVDKEMTAFIGTTHADNLTEYYKILRDRLLDPGWREEDFTRLRDRAIHNITESLRNNDEELAKEVLYYDIYEATPYGHYSGGTVKSLESLTLDDVKAFYRTHYSLSNLYLGIAGGYPDAFVENMKKDFRRLPPGGGFRPRMKPPPLIDNTRVAIVEKPTGSVALSLGFPISITRDRPDYPALLVAASYFGQHRMSGSVLYEEMREKRGLNYGDYAYIEYFPQGMFLMEPPQNIGRRYQLFQIWVRPVEPANAKFAVRMALYQLDNLIRNGISQEDFERTRDFLSKYVNVLLRTQRARLGYGIDDVWYGAGAFDYRLRTELAKVTRDDVNRTIKRYLRTSRLVIAAVAKNGEELKQQLLSEDPSPMKYNSPKPDDVIEIDRVAEKWPLNLRPEDIKIVPVEQVFQ